MTDSKGQLQPWMQMVTALADDWSAQQDTVQLVQTHISAVLIGRTRVLKLKKPVDFGFLDYTTLEKRRAACEAEVALNRRLSPDVYIGVEPVVEIGGKPRLGGAGTIIDYGVVMRRLPADRMLDHLLAQDQVTEDMIERVADRLSRFHQKARRSPEIEGFGSVEVIRRNWAENFDQTRAYVGRTISESAFSSIREWTTGWVDDHRGLFEARVRDGRIVDGHGDVRCESICMENGVSIFDCIEFNERFRFGDVAGEVAFLAMDLDARGRPDLGYYFTECYDRHSRDLDMFTLLPFYRCYRAYVRGKVLSFRLDEPEFSETERASAATRARWYFNLARRYAAPLERRTLVVVSGLSGTGKTSVARTIAGELGLRVISADAIRRTLFGHTQRKYLYGQGPYRAEANRATYSEMIRQGRNEIEKRRGVVLDGTFRRAADREFAREMAAAALADFRMVECVLDEREVRERFERRAARHEGDSDAGWQTYQRQREEYEPVEPSDAHLRLDTHGLLTAVCHEASDWLRGAEAADSSQL